MRVHRTKNKGDLGVLAAQLDLARRGFDLLLPLTEHQAFDLVAYKDAHTDCCYYLDPRKHGEHVSLRVAPVRGRQTRRIRWAETYRNLPPEVEGVPATSTHALESAPWLRQSSWPSRTADGGVTWGARSLVG